MGVYPLLEDETCCFLAVDFDKGQWMADVSAYVAASRRFGSPLVSPSGMVETPRVCAGWGGPAVGPSPLTRSDWQEYHAEAAQLCGYTVDELESARVQWTALPSSEHS